MPCDWIGTCISIYSNCVNFGVMLSYLVGYSLNEEPEKNTPYIWRLNLTFPVIFLIFRSIIMLVKFNKDTPVYYIENNDEI